MYCAQRLCGGVPEAADGVFFGPGTGETPETSSHFCQCAAAELAAQSERERKAGMFWDFEDVKSLAQILRWLRKWRRGELRRADPDRKAGGYGQRLVWL